MSAATDDNQIESRALEIGRQIFAKSNETRGLFKKKFFANWLLAWSLKEEQLKLDLFRFIDVLPMLKQSHALGKHFSEYLLAKESELPRLLKIILRVAARLPLANLIMAWVVRQQVFRMARLFIAGADSRGVTKTVSRLWRDGYEATVDILGEAVVSEVEAQHYQKSYCDLIKDLATGAAVFSSSSPLPRANISVKCSSLCPQLGNLFFRRSVDGVKSMLRPVLRLAQENSTFIYLDMEQYEYHDIILTVAEEIFTEAEFKVYPHFGVVVQSYLKCAHRDIKRLAALCECRGVPLTVRLVKGAYWDYEMVMAGQKSWEVPVFYTKAETDASFETCGEQLLKLYPKLFTALGSHNVRSLALVLAKAESLNIPKEDIEIQMLYGMADTFKTALKAMHYRVREYAPMGKILPGMAYLVRRLLENTANQGFLRTSVTTKFDVEKLLARPVITTPPLIPKHPFLNQPLLDFSRVENRDWIKPALDKMRAQFPITVWPMISGKPADANNWAENFNPSRASESVCRFALSTPAHIKSAITACEGAKSTWGQLDVNARAEIIERVADIILDSRYELMALIVLEVGKPLDEADADVCEAVDFCRYYAAQARTLMSAPRQHNLAGENNDFSYRPRGTSVCLAPWNFPLAILCGMTVGPLVCGNSVIIKPAEQSPATAKYFYDILIRAGVDKNAVQLLPGIGGEVGADLAKHPQVNVITFTGSRAVGLQILTKTSQIKPGERCLKKVVAEMGGKNAVIIDDDADLDEAVTACLSSAFGFAGQKCSALSRIILLEPVAKLFKQRFVAGLKSFQIGPTDDVCTQIGPVIDCKARERLQQVIERNKTKILYQMPLPTGVAELGYFVPPTVFVDDDPHSELGQIEFFGPIVTLFVVRDLQAAVALANDVDYALTGGFYSRSPKNIETIKQLFEVGNLYINRGITGARVGCQPFGGFKLSGCGAKAGGPDYLLNFVEARTVTENVMRRGFV